MADALRAFEEELESKNFKGYWQNIQGDVYRAGTFVRALPLEGKRSFRRHGKSRRCDRLARILPARYPEVEPVAQERYVAHSGFEPSAAQARRRCAIAPPYGRSDSFHSKGSWHASHR